jgi:hypothetical protein
LSVVHAVQVGITSSGSGGREGNTALHAACHGVAAVADGAGNESLDLATVISSAVAVVVRGALALAGIGVGPPCAHGVLTALALGRDHATAWCADSLGGIPLAFGVTIAAVLVQEAVLALLRASSLVGLPSAHGAGSAITFGLQFGAGLHTLRGSGVPHAAVLALAGWLGGVENSASSKTGGLVPHTEVVSDAHFDLLGRGDRGRQVHVSTAEVAAGAVALDPDALSVTRAGLGGVVTEIASAFASVELPLAHGIVGTEGSDEEIAALGAADQILAVPFTVDVIDATVLVALVLVLALAAAGSDGPLALAVAKLAGAVIVVPPAVHDTLGRLLLAVPETELIIGARIFGGVTVETAVSADASGGRVPQAARVGSAPSGASVLPAVGASDLAVIGGGLEATHRITLAGGGDTL